MKEVGFTYVDIQDGTAILQGYFAGHKNCYIGVSTLKATNTVNTIGIIFPDKET